MIRDRIDNIPREELKALRALSKNDSIMIMKPDKGTGVVIMNMSDYLKKMNDILSDTSKFKRHNNQDLYKVSRSIETKVRNFLLRKLKKPGHITDEQYRMLYPHGSHIGILYGLPKVHKTNCPTRPICSAVGTSTAGLSKFVTNIIKPAATNCNGTDIKDTFHFVDTIGNIDLRGKFLVSYDVRSLFTNVPLRETIDICLNRLYHSDHCTPPSIPENILKEMLELCLRDNIFVFNNTVYKQVDGVAMGNSLGPVIANIIMAHIEETYFLQCPVSPSFYGRYADDNFCVFNSREEANTFLTFINNNPYNSIRFDMEIEDDNKLAFLDTIIAKTDSSKPVIATKEKDTDRGLFYHFSSFSPDRYKYSLVFIKFYRAYKIASDWKVFDIDARKITDKLLRNGFPIHLIQHCLNKVVEKFHYNIVQRDTVTEPEPVKKVTLVLPFLGNMSYIMKTKLSRLVKKYYPRFHFSVVFEKGYTIGQLFSKKDRFPITCQSHVVYNICCSKCGPSQAYTGKTVNTVYERFFSSNGHLNPCSNDSALLKHLSSNAKCDFDFNTIKLLDRAKSDLQLKFVESILLKYGPKQNINTAERSIELQLF